MENTLPVVLREQEAVDQRSLMVSSIVGQNLIGFS